MKMSVSWCAVASAVLLVGSLVSGCGGPVNQDGEPAVEIQWSESAGQCLADHTPIVLDGVSSQAACSQLGKSAAEGTLRLPSRYGGVSPLALCCAEVCTVTPSGMECSGTVCVRCALPY